MCFTSASIWIGHSLIRVGDTVEILESFYSSLVGKKAKVLDISEDGFLELDSMKGHILRPDKCKKVQK